MSRGYTFPPRSDDGHGPSYGCTYAKCGNPEAEAPCPFVKDETSVVLGDQSIPTWVEHKHEWRQLMIAERYVTPHQAAFFCIHCKKVET